MSDDDGEVIPLYPHEGDNGGRAITRWSERLAPYLDERAVVADLRHRPQPEMPWPEKGNPMLGYLIDRANGIVTEDGLEAGLVWLAVHAWFEGALEARYEMARHVLDE